jgi:hypothetical protein
VTDEKKTDKKPFQSLQNSYHLNLQQLICILYNTKKKIEIFTNNSEIIRAKFLLNDILCMLLCFFFNQPIKKKTNYLFCKKKHKI